MYLILLKKIGIGDFGGKVLIIDQAQTNLEFQNGFEILKSSFTPNLQTLKTKVEPLFQGNFETGIEPMNGIGDMESDPRHTRQICNAWKSDND